MRQCPKCELKFLTDVELDDHLVRDHGVDPESLPQRPLSPPRRPPRRGRR